MKRIFTLLFSLMTIGAFAQTQDVNVTVTPSFYEAPENGESIGQSFTAGMTGILSSVELQMYTNNCSNLTQIEATIELLDGDGMGGTVLATEDVIIPLNLTTGGFFTFTFSNPSVITSGSQYSIKLSHTVFQDCNGAGGTPYFWWATENSDIYAGGSGYYDGVPVARERAINTYVSCNALSITDNDPTCVDITDGEITITPLAGTAYVYSWDYNAATTQNISGLGDGVYNVTMVADGSCTITKSITLTDPSFSALSLTTGGTSQISCEYSTTGAIEAFPVGGASGYTYLWSTTQTSKEITGLSKDTYLVTVTDACGSTITDSFVLNEQYEIIVNATVTDVNCNGNSDGSIDHVANTTRSAFEYVWNTGATTAGLSALGAGEYTVTTSYNGCDKVSSYTITEPASALSATLICNSTSGTGASDGSSSVSAMGGTTPYSYDWGSGATTAASMTGLMAGAVNITVTDANGCEAEEACTITDDPCTSVTSSSSATDVTCGGGSDGSAMASMSGGPGTVYTYTWSNGAMTATATGLMAGTYAVTVSDGTCEAMESVTVGETYLSYSDTATFVWAYDTSYVCAGDSILLEGTYYKDVDTVLVASTSMNGCDSTIVMTIQKVTITLGLTSDQSDICSGTMIVLDANASGADTYSWTPNVGTTETVTDTPTDTTEYVVVATDTESGCTAMDNVEVNVATTPSLTVAQNYYGSPTCLDSIQATTDADTLFLWTLPTGGFIQNKSGLLVVQVANTTEAYTVEVTLASGCTASETINVLADVNCGPLGVEELDKDFIEAYLTNDVLYVNLYKVQGHVMTIYDITGKAVYNTVLRSNRTQLDMAAYHNGVYLISITDQEGKVTTTKVVK